MCHRQGPEQLVFKEVLDGLGAGKVMLAGWELLMSHRVAVVDRPGGIFKDAAHLFPTNYLINAYNTKTLANTVML